MPSSSSGKPRVCLFADFPVQAIHGGVTGRGGGQVATWLPQLARAFASQADDLDVHWCVLVKKLRRRQTESAWGQTFHLIPGGRLTTGLLFNHGLPRRAFRHVLSELQPNLIHCWGTENLNSSALWEYSGPSILSMQGIIALYSRTGALPGWRWRLMRDWEPLALNRAKVVTSESAWGVVQLKRLHSELDIRQIEYGAENSFFEVEWNPEPTSPRILFGGTFNQIKGFDILLAMLKRHPTFPWKLVIAGSGAMENDLRSLNHPSVEFCGMLTSQDLQKEMSRAWALVLPSRADTSPNIVKEARVIGLPIVVSPHGGHSSYIRDEEDGLLIHSEDPEAWFNALNRLAEDMETCRRMGAAGRTAYRELLRPEHTATSFLNLYRQMLHLPEREIHSLRSTE